jgi:hypothetical protein
MKPAIVLLAATVLASLLSACGSSQTAQSARHGAASGAAMGALAGLVFGGDIDDMVEGAAIGGAAGAGAGAISGSAREKQRYRDSRRIKEAEYREAQARARAEAAEAKAGDAQLQVKLTEQETISILGPDTWEGYKALRSCQAPRASGLAQAGKAATDPDHQLAAEWLMAIIAVDTRNTGEKTKAFERLVQMDRDIDTTQQASLEVDKIVLEMRDERTQMGIRC